MRHPVVLCVDDELEGLIGREALLKQKGCQVLISTIPHEALKLFASCHVDAVVLDYQMPEMRGDMVALQMKQLKPDIPIMLLSAHDSFPKEMLDHVDVSLGISGAVALTFSPDGTLLYTVANSYPPVSSNTTLEQLATINPLTGQATLIGSPFPFRVGIMPMAVSSSGTIFAAGTSAASPVSLANTLLTINPLTGQPTAVGAFGVTGMMDFAYDPNGTLYGATTTKLYTINTSTGAATLVSPFSGVSGVMGITFDAVGNLFATNFSATSSLYSVNRTTGAATLIGPTGVGDVHSADVKPIPEPGTLVLFGSGLVGVVSALRRKWLR